jgi:lysophospholipase L1-like esterase
MLAKVNIYGSRFRRMQLLFIGNSLTRGQIGSSYIDLLKADNPEWHINNVGVDGDTLKNISDRVQKEVVRTKYDHIIIEAGHNDIILPSFTSKGILFGLAFKYLRKQGRRPLDLSDFKTEYTKMIQYL